MLYEVITEQSSQALNDAPLAERLRPRNLAEMVGQQHLIGEGKVLRRLIESDQVASVIFWGPPGTGKTTLAQVIANTTRSRFVFFSAVLQGVITSYSIHYTKLYEDDPVHRVIEFAGGLARTGNDQRGPGFVD